MFDRSKDGLAGIANGELLTRAQVEFDIFITGDRNLTFQQPTTSFDIVVIVLHAASIQLPDTLPLMSKVLKILPTISPGIVVQLS